MDKTEFLSAIEKQLTIPISEDLIRARAEKLWLEEQGHDSVYYWLKAEKQLRSELILKNTLLPNLQEFTAEIQLELRNYSSSAMTVLSNELDKNILTLPEGTRYHRQVGSRDIIVVEHKPCTRTIFVDKQYHLRYIGSEDREKVQNSSTEYVRISLPYVVYILVTDDQRIDSRNFYITFRSSRITSLSDEIMLPHLPNTYGDGRVCCKFSKNKKEYSEIINDYIDQYWQAKFIYSLHSNLPNKAELQTWDGWEKLTKEDPLAVLKASWYKIGTLNSILNRYKKEPPPSKAFQELSSKFIQTTAKILSVK